MVRHFTKDCQFESSKDEMINLIDDIEEETTLLMMSHSSKAEHMKLKSSTRQPSRLERLPRHVDSPNKSVEHEASLGSWLSVYIA